MSRTLKLKLKILNGEIFVDSLCLSQTVNVNNIELGMHLHTWKFTWIYYAPFILTIFFSLSTTMCYVFHSSYSTYTETKIVLLLESTD